MLMSRLPFLFKCSQPKISSCSLSFLNRFSFAPNIISSRASFCSIPSSSIISMYLLRRTRSRMIAFRSNPVLSRSPKKKPRSAEFSSAVFSDRSDLLSQRLRMIKFHVSSLVRQLVRCKFVKLLFELRTVVSSDPTPAFCRVLEVMFVERFLKIKISNSFHAKAAHLELTP